MTAHTEGDESRVAELLIRWEEQRERGRSVTPEELCSSCPELAEELDRRIALLRRLDPVLDGTATAEAEPRPVSAGPAVRESATARAEFRDLRFHAAGALGEVFLARSAELNREVALKFLKPTRQRDPASRRRFLQEAEVTGRLEHPGIVPIYALGADATGSPCYAMRFIRGATLQDAIDAFHAAERPGRDPSERSLALRDLLSRFVSICGTMAYAHSRGILHRDLKPRNVMLGKYDETLVVDWGLAKPFERDESAQSVGEEPLTPGSGSGEGGSDTPTIGVVGTLAYMSPEQAEARWDRVGPASDLFGLGGILYAILTGQAPYQEKTLGEVLERVKRCEFPPPRQVKPGVPRPLEAICLKAMARRPEERYSTALDLAADVRRWLADEPVSAWREPLVPRARRWMRRHQAAVASAAAMLLTGLVALTGGIVAVSLQKQETLRQGLRAEANFQKAVDAVERLLTRIGRERLKDVPQMESLRSELLDDALEFQRGFLTDHGDDPGTRLGAARVARMAGVLQGQLNRLAEAERSCRQALAMVDDLIIRSPNDRRYRRERAAGLDTLGLALDWLGRSDEAESAYRASIDASDSLVREDPTSGEDRWRLAVGLNHLGLLLHGAGRMEEAESALVRGRRACEAAPASAMADPRVRRELAAILGHLGLVLKDRGHLAESLDIYDHAARMQRARLAAAPHSADDRELLGVLLANQASVLEADGQARAAKRVRVEVRDLALRLQADYPTIPRYRQGAAVALANLANRIRRDPARAAEAHGLLDQAISLQESVVAISPTVPDHRSKLAEMYDALASLLRDQGALEEAESAYRKDLSYQSRLAGEYPQAADYRFGHGQVLHNLADLLRGRGRLEQALPLAREAVREFGRLYGSNPRNPDYRGAYSYACWTLAQILVDRRDHRAASDVVAEYLQIEPNGFEESRESAGFLCRCVRLCREDPSVAEPQREARAYAGRAMEALRTAVRKGFRDARHLEKAETYGPLRDREDFRRLLAELWDRAFPVDPFAG
jgi:serine/threonine-protein kinase